MIMGSQRILALVPIIVTCAISLAYLFVPIYETSSGRETVIESNGGWVLALLLAPVVIALLPVVVNERNRIAGRRWSATLLAVFALVTGFTIGTPYLLPAVLLWIVWALERRSSRSSDVARGPEDQRLARG
jgi:hypothetical protein